MHRLRPGGSHDRLRLGPTCASATARMLARGQLQRVAQVAGRDRPGPWLATSDADSQRGRRALGRIEARGELAGPRVVAFGHHLLVDRAQRHAEARTSRATLRIARAVDCASPTRIGSTLIRALASRSFAVSSSTSRRAQLVGDPVGDEARRALDDLLAHLEVVLLQGAAGGDEVDDAVGEADQRRQLDRALDLDHLDLAAGRLEVALGDARVLGRDPHHPEAPLGLAQALVAPAPGEHHAAAAEAEVEQLVDDAVGLLEQDVLAGDADVGGAGLDVGRARRRAASSPG